MIINFLKRLYSFPFSKNFTLNIKNYYFYKDSNPKGNFGDAGIYYDIKENRLDSFFSGIDIYYSELVPYDPENPEITSDTEKKIDENLNDEYVLNNINKVQDILSNLNKELYKDGNIIQLVGEKYYLKMFILALYRNKFFQQDILTVGDDRSIDDILRDKKSGYLIITDIKNPIRFVYIARDLKNFVIILTEKKIKDDRVNIKDILLQNLKTNPFNYDQ